MLPHRSSGLPACIFCFHKRICLQVGRWKIIDTILSEHRASSFTWLCVCVLSHFSHVWLCDPVNYGPPGSSVHWILQARMLEWIAMPSSRGSSQPRDQTQVCCIAGRFFTIWATREVGAQLMPTLFIEKTILSSLNCLFTFVEKSVDHEYKGLFFNSILFHWSMSDMTLRSHVIGRITFQVLQKLAL